MANQSSTPEPDTIDFPPTPVSAGTKKTKAPSKATTKASSGPSKTEALLWDIAAIAKDIDFAALAEKHGYKNAKSARDTFAQMKARHFKNLEPKEDNNATEADEPTPKKATKRKATKDAEDGEEAAAPKKVVKRKVAAKDGDDKVVKKPRKTKAKAATTEEAEEEAKEEIEEEVMEETTQE